MVLWRKQYTYTSKKWLWLWKDISVVEITNWFRLVSYGPGPANHAIGRNSACIRTPSGHCAGRDGLILTRSLNSAYQRTIAYLFGNTLRPSDKTTLGSPHWKARVSFSRTIWPRPPPPPPPPPIANLDITTTGVERLLARLDPNKASGPDNISCRILKELAVELAPALTAILNQSIDSGSLPTEWTKANVTPIYNKANKNQTENYRPVSLTCVVCKVLEHITCSHMHKHLEQHDILPVYSMASGVDDHVRLR